MEINTFMMLAYASIINKLNESEDIHWVKKSDGTIVSIAIYPVNDNKRLYAYETFTKDTEQKSHLDIFLESNGTLSYRMTDVFNFDEVINDIKNLDFKKDKDFFGS